MNSKSKRTAVLVLVAILGYGLGLWAIQEFLGKDPLSMDAKAERVLDCRLSGSEPDGKVRRYRRALSASADPAHGALLVALDRDAPKREGPKADPRDTMILSDLLRVRSGALRKDSLVVRMTGMNPDSARFYMPLYWALKDLGSMDSGIAAFPLPPGFLKSVAKGLHRHDEPFKAAELFAVCMKRSGVEQDPELPAWYGSALTKRALFVESSLDKIHMVKDGVKHLDKAVYDNPDFGAIRYIRANTYASLPGIFQKEALLREDIQYLLDVLGRDGTVKMSVAGGEPVDAPVNVEQVKTILVKAMPLFEGDKQFHEVLRSTLVRLEKKS